MQKRKDLLVFAFKRLFSLAIITFLLIYKTSVKEILEILRGASLFCLGLSFSLHAIGLLISVYRWQILIRAQGDYVPLSFLTQSYLVGTFFNNFLPTRFGGDVVRIWDGTKYSRSLLKSSATVLVERFPGIVVLLILIIPITISGLGLREGSYVEIFKSYGIPAQAAVSFGLIIGVVSGIIYTVRK